MLKESGMGELPANYQVADATTNNNLFDFDKKVNQQVKNLIEQAEKLAFKTLKQQELLLVKMADFLSDNRMLQKDKIKVFLFKYAKDFNRNSIIENGDNLFYRKHLKQKVDEFNITSENSLVTINSFSLNKDAIK